MRVMCSLPAYVKGFYMGVRTGLFVPQYAGTVQYRTFLAKSFSAGLFWQNRSSIRAREHRSMGACTGEIYSYTSKRLFGKNAFPAKELTP